MPPPASPPLRATLASFADVASCSVQGCPKPGAGAPTHYFTMAPRKPCNLLKLQVVEPQAEPGGKAGTRAGDFLRAPKRLRNQSPVTLRAGTDCLQITARSQPQGPRQLKITSLLDGWCGDVAHQSLRVTGPDMEVDFPSPTVTVHLPRRALPSDQGGVPGFWSFINACWQLGADPAEYQVSSVTCGLPSSGGTAPEATLLGRIEVYPADKFSLSLTIPALLKPSALSLDWKSDSWKSEAEMRKATAQREADAYYASEATFFREAGVSRADVRDFLAEKQKMKSGQDDPDYLGKLKAKFKQTDGNREIEAPIDELVKLVRCIRDTEYAAKSIGDWISKAQVGPGASVKIDCQFLIGTLNASWRRMEHTDDRVFMGWRASLDITVVKLNVNIAVGWRCAGLADLFIELAGQGSLAIAGSAESTAPDSKTEVAIKPSGKLALSGKIKGELMWSVSGETGVECEFTADCKDFHLMKASRPVSGKIVVKRGAVFSTVAYKCSMFGGTAEKEEIVAANASFASFELGA